MGIDGLMGFLKPITVKTHISEFREKRLGVDILPWLYKACYSDVMQSDQNDPSKTLSCSRFLFSMLDLMERYSIDLVPVYDGRSLPMKQMTIQKRIKERGQYKNIAKSHYDNNDKEKTKKWTARSIRLTNDIIQESMSILKTKKISFIVSPYQSDSQLAKLRNMGLIDAVISEDSDLLVYGCNLICKLEEQGICKYIDINSQISKSFADDVKCPYISKFLEFSPEERVYTCILSGCDYLKSLRGIGIKKAIKLVSQERDFFFLLTKLEMQWEERVSSGYKQQAIKAFYIFSHATVYNPRLNKLQSLKALKMPEVQSQWLDEIIGSPYSQYLQKKIYEGQVCPRTLQKRTIKFIQLPQAPIQKIKLKELQIKNQSQTFELLNEMENDFQGFDKWETTQVEQHFWQNYQNYLSLCVKQVLL